VNENLALVPSVPRELTPSIWHMIEAMAPVLARSRMFGATSAEAAAATMLKGYELGIGFTASFELIQVIQSRASLSPRGALALLHNSPEITRLEIKRLTDAAGAFTGYECTMARRNGFCHTAHFTLDEAKRAGLIKPGSGWANYPENMCLWRAVGFAADVVAPDITAGLTTMMKTPEEFGMTISQAGDVIDVIPTPILSPFDAALADLLARFDASDILTVNNSVLPETLDEVERIAAMLAVAAEV
jgi:hypothetical protein